jgi:hypothetical protein
VEWEIRERGPTPREGTVRYYDISPPSPIERRPEYVEVHRVYCFDFYNHEPEPSELEAIFASLPGYRRDWTWFGESRSGPPYLSASSDFDGLTVVGILRETDWRAWDRAFQDRTSHLPIQREEQTAAPDPPPPE